MTNVTARKIRDLGRERPAVGVGRVYNGFLVSYPVVGRGMVIFRDPNGHRMITTPVRRVLADPDGETVYVGYAYNRAVLFDARTFHRSAAMHFSDADSEGYRLNLSLAFDHPERRRARLEPYGWYSVNRE